MQNPQREVQPTMTFNIYLSYDKVTVSTTTPLSHSNKYDIEFES